MALTREALEEFKSICWDEFDIELTDTEAEQRALEVLAFFWLLTTGEHTEKAIIDEIPLVILRSDRRKNPSN